jgi:hypothetical protein
MNCELQRGSQPAQPFEPPSQRFTIVPLAAECVMPAKAVMNIWGTALQDRSVVLLIHSKKVLLRNSFDNRVILTRLRLNLERATLPLVYAGGVSGGIVIAGIDDPLSQNRDLHLYFRSSQ